MIAERHFAKRERLEQIAQDLGVSPDLVKDTYGRMLQEVGVTAANQFGQEIGEVKMETND
jgi:AraC-like DNA-binding protein